MFGMALIAIGCFSSAVGMLLMKASAELESSLPMRQRKRWMLGFVFLVVNAAVIDMIAFAITPLALIAPFAGLTIAFTTLLSASGWFHVKEQLSRREMVATYLVLLGVTLVSIYGPRPQQEEQPLSDMLDNLVQPGFLGCTLLTLLPACGGALLVWRGRALTGMSSIFLAAYTGALCGALTQLFFKIIATAVHAQLAGTAAPWLPRDPSYPLPYLAVLGMACTAPGQLYLLNHTLASTSISLAVPLYSSLLIILTVALGGVFFREFSHSPRGSTLAFAVSLVLVVAGLSVLSTAHAKPRQDGAADAKPQPGGTKPARAESGTEQTRLISP